MNQLIKKLIDTDYVNRVFVEDGNVYVELKTCSLTKQDVDALMAINREEKLVNNCIISELYCYELIIRVGMYAANWLIQLNTEKLSKEDILALIDYANNNLPIGNTKEKLDFVKSNLPKHFQ